MATNESPAKPTLEGYWPRGEPKIPSPWCLPLAMVLVGKIVAVETLAKSDQVFKSQNWSAQIQVPIQRPDWLLDNFPELLDSFHADTFALDLFRFHLGSPLDIGEWEDQWFLVMCQPHFSFVPCVLSGAEEPTYKRLAWVKDNGLTPIAERVCADIPGPFPTMPPFVTFNGFVDTHKFVLAENDTTGIDAITRNCSAVFKTWSRFTRTEHATTPATGWYPNYVYAMIPKCKPHLRQKCENYRADTSPFRKGGKKAYVTGFFHGFCNKKLVFSSDTPYNPLEFVPFVEITDIDWAANEPRQSTTTHDPFSTPTKPNIVAKNKGKFVFDPFAQMSADAVTPSISSQPDSQSSDLTIQAADSFSTNELQNVTPLGSKRLGEPDHYDESSDGASPTKRSKQGSLRGRPKNKTG